MNNETSEIKPDIAVNPHLSKTDVTPESTSESELHPHQTNKPAKPQKSEFERLSNHVDTLIKEKKAHLKKISILEEKLEKTRQELDQASANSPQKSSEVVDIFSTAHGSAAKYVAEIKSLADEELVRAKLEAQRILDEAENEANNIKDKIQEESIHIRNKAKLTLQKANQEKLTVETQISEANTKADSTIERANEEAKSIIIRAKEEASDILSEANKKLKLADSKYKQSVQRITSQTNQIVNCAKIEYEQLRRLIEKSTQQYTELCETLADFNNLIEYTQNVIDTPSPSDQ